MSTQILPDRLKRFLDKVHLRRGYGPGVIAGKVDVCLMQAVDWITGGNGCTAHPPCVAGTLVRYGSILNDSDLFAEHRDLLKPYAVKLIGTNTTTAAEQKRAFIATDYAVRVFAPIWLRTLGFRKQAAHLANCTPIASKASAKRACIVAKAVSASVAWHSIWSVGAAAYHYDAAYRAAYYAAHRAVCHAAGAAAEAAEVAAYTVRQHIIAEHGDELRALSLECFDKMIAFGSPLS